MKIKEAPQTTGFDKPRGSPQEFSEFLMRSVGSRKKPSRDNAHTLLKKPQCCLFSFSSKDLYRLVLNNKNKRNAKSQHYKHS